MAYEDSFAAADNEGAPTEEPPEDVAAGAAAAPADGDAAESTEATGAAAAAATTASTTTPQPSYGSLAEHVMSRRDFASLPEKKQRKILAIREYHRAKASSGGEPFPKAHHAHGSLGKRVKPSTPEAADDAVAEDAMQS